jgi:DNA-binding transcriptional LysR family regulator
MNIVHIKYAIEVARVGSINKASENLGMAQPNISRAIKDLESDFGITIFDRSAKGMNLTPEGQEFIVKCQKILEQMNELERIYKGMHPGRENLSIALPETGYISSAISEYMQNLDNDAFEFIFSETSSEGALKKVLDSEYGLGIVRCDESSENIFLGIFKEKRLEHILLSNLEQMVIISGNSKLASAEIIDKSDLEGLVEVTGGESADHFRVLDSIRSQVHDHGVKCIHTSGALTRLELISKNENSFMIAPPLCRETATRFNLVQIPYAQGVKQKDYLVYRSDRTLSKSEKSFTEFLKNR